MMRADFAEYSAGKKNMDIFVDCSQRDCRHQLLHLDEDFFRAGVAVHGLHDFVDDLTLVRHCEPLLGAKIAKCLGSLRGHKTY